MEPDLMSLLSAWLGQEIEPERHEALLERLGRDPEFRCAFVAEARMLGMLKVVQAPEPRWLRLEDELGWGASESSTPEPLEDRVMRELDEAPRSFPAAPARLRWAIAAAAAAAVVLATLAATIAVLNPRPKGPTEIRVAEVRRYPRVDTSTGLAMVILLEHVSWEPASEPHPAEGDVLAAGRLRIASGRAVLSMLTGVVLDVEGPADLDLLDSGRVYCRRGRIRARVPAGAEGFLVLGPSSAVVDLGTEFGLNVGPDGKLRGEIFQGKLEAALLSESGTPQRSFFLDAAQAPSRKAFEIDSRAGSIEAVATSDDFIKASNPVSPPLELDGGYAEAVRQSGPWGYWRFNSLDRGSVPNDVPGRPALRATGPICLGAASGGNRWAEFRPTDGPQLLELDQPWRPTWPTGFAIEFWCLSESIGHESLVGLVSPKDTDHHVFLMELTSRNRLTMHKPASVRLLHRWPSGWEAGDNAYSQNPYVPYRWHHVVGQVHPDRIELFLDGQRSAALSIRPEHSDVACQLLLGRLSTRPGSGLSIDRPFVGRLDEVALYDRPLSPEEVRDHHRRASGASGSR
jgi:Concanavalin A-like lectin/glucanases superfamily